MTPLTLLARVFGRHVPQDVQLAIADSLNFLVNCGVRRDIGGSIRMRMCYDAVATTRVTESLIIIASCCFAGCHAQQVVGALIMSISMPLLITPVSVDDDVVSRWPPPPCTATATTVTIGSMGNW